MAIALASTQSKEQARTWTKTGEPVCLITIPYSAHAVKTTSRPAQTLDVRLAKIKLLHDRYIVGPAVLHAESAHTTQADGESG